MTVPQPDLPRFEPHYDPPFVYEAAKEIMAGLLSNPNVVVYDPQCGWVLCNCKPVTLAEFTWECARALNTAQAIPPTDHV